MLINHLMDKLSKEAAIAVSLIQKQGSQAHKDEIINDLYLVYTKARQSYDAGSQHQAQFNHYLSESIRYWLQREILKLKRDRALFRSLSDYDCADNADPGIGLIIDEIRERLSDKKATVFDYMLYVSPDTKKIVQGTGLNTRNVYYAKSKIQQSTLISTEK